MTELETVLADYVRERDRATALARQLEGATAVIDRLRNTITHLEHQVAARQCPVCGPSPHG